jgi:hypothetical protein
MPSVPNQHTQGSLPPTGKEPLIVLRSPGDLLAYLPYEIGYHPAPDDVVFVGLRGSQPQGVAVLNTSDLAIGSEPRTVWHSVVAQVLDPAAGLVRAIARAGHDVDLASLGEPGVVLISYGSPGADALARALRTLHAPELIDVLRVHAGRWWSLACHGASCCPPEGNPLDTATAAAAGAVASGRNPRATRGEVSAVLQPGPAELVRVAATHLPTAPAVEDPAHRPPSVTDGLAALRAAWLARRPRLHDSEQDSTTDFTTRAAQQGTSEAAAEAARLLHALEDYRVRDRCLAWSDAAGSCGAI